MSVRTAWTGAAISLVVLFLAAGLLNWLCLLLSPLAVLPLIVYPYAKRFTELPARRAGAGPGGRAGRRLARGHRAPSRVRPAWLLGVAVGLWIGGFDLIYACQDAEVDRADRRALVAGPLRRAPSRCTLSDRRRTW